MRNLHSLIAFAALLLPFAAGCATEPDGADGDDPTATTDGSGSDSADDVGVSYLSNTPICGTYYRHVGLCGAWFQQPYFSSPTGWVCTYQVYDVSYYSNGYGGPVVQTNQWGVPCGNKFGG